MNHLILKALLPLVLLFSLSVNAQSKERITYGLSLDIGANYLGNVVYRDLSRPRWAATQQPSLNFGIGGFLRQPISQRFSIESGVGYSFNRAKFNFISSGSVRFLLHHVEVPIIVNYNIVLSNKSVFVVSAGLNLKYAAAISDRWEGVVHEEIYTGTNRDKFRSFNYGAIVRAAYQFDLNPRHKLELGLQLCQNLNKITTNKAKNWPYSGHFTGNLLNARFTDFGISIKYFL